MWPEPKPISIPSFILIYPSVWPEYTNVQMSQTGQTGQLSNSTGRTVKGSLRVSGVSHARHTESASEAGCS